MSTWLITGATSGFGRDTADRALAQGHHVIAVGRRGDRLADLVASAPAGQVTAVALDLTAEDAESTLRQAVTTAGGVDVVVNNADYGLFAAVEDTTAAVEKRMFDVNVLGSLAVIRATLPALRASKGRIIQLSSYVGSYAWASSGVYSASKAAVELYSDALAIELAPAGIRVSLVEPGLFGTEFTASAEIIAPSEPYVPTVGAFFEQFQNLPKAAYGNPGDVADAITAIAGMDEPPLRCASPSARTLLTPSAPVFRHACPNSTSGQAPRSETTGTDRRPRLWRGARCNGRERDRQRAHALRRGAQAAGDRGTRGRRRQRLTDRHAAGHRQHAHPPRHRIDARSSRICSAMKLLLEYERAAEIEKTVPSSAHTWSVVRGTACYQSRPPARLRPGCEGPARGARPAVLTEGGGGSFRTGAVRNGGRSAVSASTNWGSSTGSSDSIQSTTACTTPAARNRAEMRRWSVSSIDAATTACVCTATTLTRCSSTPARVPSRIPVSRTSRRLPRSRTTRCRLSLAICSPGCSRPARAAASASAIDANASAASVTARSSTVAKCV